MPATGSRRREGSAWTMGRDSVVANLSDSASWDPFPSPNLPELWMKQRLIDIMRMQYGDGIHQRRSAYPISIARLCGGLQQDQARNTRASPTSRSCL